jgi:hypothetical protein
MGLIFFICCVGLLFWENKREKPRNYLSVIYIIVGLCSLMAFGKDENYDPDFQVGNEYVIDETYFCAKTKASIQEAHKTNLNYELLKLTWSPIKIGTKIELTENDWSAKIYGFQCLDGKYYGQHFYCDKDIFKHKKEKSQ